MTGMTICVVHTVDVPIGSLDAVFSMASTYNAALDFLVISLSTAIPSPDTLSETDTSWASRYLEAVQMNHDRVQALRVRGHQWGGQYVVSGLCEQLGMIDRQAARHALYANLTILHTGFTDRGEMTRALHGVLFEAGSAALVLPARTKMTSLAPPRRILVAWQPVAQAGRALRFSLGLLDSRCDVQIILVDDHEREGDLQRLDSFMCNSGQPYTVERVGTQGRRVADVLIDQATLRNVDWVVMGAYGHSPLRERLFGGTTQQMLADLKLPVLMMH